MSAPDHHPYLTAADLRTPLDVALWLKKRWLKSSANRDYSTWQEHQILEEVYDALDERLDRERRQACRRRALERWRTFSEAVRDYARQKRDEGLIYDTETEYYIEQYLTEALAFRDAARQP